MWFLYDFIKYVKLLLVEVPQHVERVKIFTQAKITAKREKLKN